MIEFKVMTTEHIQCIVVSSCGCLGARLTQQKFTMLNTQVEWDETPTEAAFRVVKNELGHYVAFESLQRLHVFNDEQSFEHIYMAKVPNAFMRKSKPGFQWLTPAYLRAVEKLTPSLLQPGMMSTYLRAASIRQRA